MYSSYKGLTNVGKNISEVGVLPYWGRYKTKLKVFRVSGVWSEPDLRIFWVLSIRLSLPSVFMRIERTRAIFWGGT